MTDRLAVAFAVALLAAPPALAQMEPSRELEFGGGWFQDNPLDVDDISVVASGPSVDLAWTTWRNERTGIAIAARGKSPAAFDPRRILRFPAEFCHFTLHPADLRCMPRI